MRAKCKEDAHRKETHREEFKTFNDYCKGKWVMAKSYAFYLVKKSLVPVNLLTHGVHPGGRLCAPCEIQPINAKQIRSLTVLEPNQQCEVWKEAVRTADGKIVTYQQVKALVAELIGPAPSPPPPKKQEDPEPFSVCTNGVFWKDAKQIVGIHAEQWYAEIPRWAVKIVSCESNQGTAPGA